MLTPKYIYIYIYIKCEFIYASPLREVLLFRFCSVRLANEELVNQIRFRCVSVLPSEKSPRNWSEFSSFFSIVGKRERKNERERERREERSVNRPRFRTFLSLFFFCRTVDFFFFCADSFKSFPLHRAEIDFPCAKMMIHTSSGRVRRR